MQEQMTHGRALNEASCNVKGWGVPTQRVQCNATLSSVQRCAVGLSAIRC